MGAKDPIIDLSLLDFDHIVADKAEINQFNEQRFEMEQLDAIIYEDREKGIAVGYKDLTSQEFWVRGHMPGSPLMPGVLMCEAAAQLCAFYAKRMNMVDDQTIIGFAGLDDIRFRGVVVPGDRLTVIIKLVKLNRLLVTCDFQCFVGKQLVCHGTVKGAPVPKSMISKLMQK